jgi:hypothetical protein
VLTFVIASFTHTIPFPDIELSRNQAKKLVDDGKKRPAESYGSREEAVTGRGEQDGYQQSKESKKGHDDAMKHMQTRSQAADNRPVASQKSKSGGIFQPGGGGR